MREKIRYLIIPINRKGINDYNYGIEESKNCITYQLPEEEFERLYSTVFDAINKRCGLLIDDYESEEISVRNIERCLDIIGMDIGVFNEACMKALKYGTFVGIDF